MVSKSEAYQQRAAECLRLAQTVNDPTSKAILLEMAQAWMKLAMQTKPNGDTSQR